MSNRVIVALAVGILIGSLLSGTPAVAQQIARLYGTVSGGAPIPLAADSSGRLTIVIQ